MCLGLSAVCVVCYFVQTISTYLIKFSRICHTVKLHSHIKIRQITLSWNTNRSGAIIGEHTQNANTM